MNLSVYSQAGVIKEIAVPDVITKHVSNSHVLHQVVVSEAANARYTHSAAKRRGEVSGGGKKPWRQKGTGRARHGSSRSPIWVGGGITFGPLAERNFDKGITRLMRARAFQMALAAVIQAKRVRVVDGMKDLPVKTKGFAALLAKLPDLGKRQLVILSEWNPTQVLGLRNLRNVTTATADSVKTTDLLKFDTLVVTPESLAELVRRGFDVELVITESAPEAKAEKPTAKTKLTKTGEEA